MSAARTSFVRNSLPLFIAGAILCQSPAFATMVSLNLPPAGMATDVVSRNDGTQPAITPGAPFATLSQGFFAATLSGISGNYDIANGPYPAWCGAYEITHFTTASTAVTPISTYSALAPVPPQGNVWPEVNYILNNKTLNGSISPSINDVQAAIWEILTGAANVPALTDGTLSSNDLTMVGQLVSAAQANPNYVPSSGGVIAVDLYHYGLQDLLGNILFGPFQDMIIEVPVGAIGDYVWNDQNGDGIQDAGDQGIDAVTVYLCAAGDANCGTAGDTPIATTTTSYNGQNHGYYEFSGMALGTYVVAVPFAQSALSSFSGPSPVGATSATATPTICAGAGCDSVGSPDTVTLTVAAPSNQTVDFGFIPAGSGVIGDYVWSDSNNDGLQNNGEAGINGVTVNLYTGPGCATPDGSTATTNGPNGAPGWYQFTGLVAGMYCVQVVTPSTFTPTTPFVGNNPAINSSGVPSGNNAQSTATVSLTTGQTDDNVDFGFVPPAQGAIGTLVWADLNGNGSQDSGEPGINNVQLELCSNVTCTGAPDPLQTANTGPSGSGYYQFTGLAAGTYYVVVVNPPAGYTPTVTGPGDENVGSGSPVAVTLSTDSSTNETIDFGYVPPCNGSIGGVVWSDNSKNGQQESGELGIPGATVYLNLNSVQVKTATTANDGSYLFSNVCTGTYTVTVLTPSNFAPDSAASTFPVNLSNTTVENVGSGASVTLPVSGSFLYMDFGFYESVSTTGSSCTNLTNGSLPVGYGEVGVSFNTVAPTISGATAPITFTALGSYFATSGLTLNVDGSISGKPTAAGSFQIQATDAFGYVVTFCVVQIDTPLQVVCPPTSASTGEAGVAFTPGPINVSGGSGPGTYSFSVSIAGSLPAGLSLNASTGAITGTPSPTWTYPATFSVAVTDSLGGTATTCPYTINGPLSVTCPSTGTTGDVGMSFSSPAITVTGGVGPYTFAIATGSLPAGLTLNGDGSITGIPGSSGSFTVKVSDSLGTSATTCPYTINPGLSVTCASNTNGTVGSFFSSGVLAVTGGTGPYTYSIVNGSSSIFSGTLAGTGLTLNANGTVTGTPSVAGSFSVQVTDSLGLTGKSCPITINAGQIKVNCSVLAATGTVGVSFDSGPMSVSGGTPPYTYSIISGSLSGTLVLNTSTGEVKGTPASAGSFSILVTDSKGQTGTGCTIVINPAPLAVTCGSNTTGTVGVAFNSGPLVVTGGTQPYTYSIVSGSLSGTLALNPTTGAVVGTPGVAGSFTVKVTDFKSQTATSCTIVINPAPLAVTCGSNTTGAVGVAFNSGVLAVTGGTPPYTYSIVSGSLSGTLALNPTTGAVIGTPGVAGSFTVKVTDFKSQSVTSCKIVINPAPLSVTCPGGTAQVNAAYSSIVAGSGGVPNYTYSVAAGALPTGLTLNPSTGAITGTPNAAGTFGFTIKVTDSTGAAALSSCSGSCSVGVTNTWSFTSPVGTLGTSQAYTVGGVTINAYGYTTSGKATALYAKVQSGDEFGLGISGTSGNEIDTAHFVQLDLSAAIAAGATNAQMTVNSVQCGESYSLYGSNTLGSLGTLLKGSLTADNNAFAIPNFPNYKYVSVIANSGNVLVASVSFTLGTCKIVVAAAIDLTCGTCGSGNATVGVPYSSQLGVLNGTSPYTFSMATGSSLPAGLTLNTTTGAITGTPTTAGTYNFTSKVVDKNGNIDTQFCTLVVVAQPIDLQCGSCGTNGKATAGTPYYAAYVVVNGKSPYKFTLSGALPPGLTLNTTTGAITGTPTTAGTYTFTATVVDANNNTDYVPCTIVVTAPPLDIECGACGTSGYAVVGAAYSTAFAITGGTGTFTYSIISGSLPSGLSLSGSTGKITGFPTSSGKFTFTVKVVDSAGSTDTTTCTIVVNGSSLGLACGSCGTSGNATVGTSYSSTLTATGGSGSYTYSIASGSLPTGLTLNTATGAITGKPTTAGTYSFTTQVKDTKTGNTATASCGIKVAGTPVNLYCGSCGSTQWGWGGNSGGGSNGTVGVGYSSSLSVTGGTSPYTYSITYGSLPPGLTLNTTTGAITGSPTTPGTYTFTSKVVDKNGSSDTTTCTVKIVGVTIDIECGACGQNANPTTGIAYSESVSVNGGTAPYTYSISSGSLPPGLTLNTSSGVISGTPNTAGTYTFTTKVVDKNGNNNTATCTIKVSTPPINLQTGTCGSTKGQSGHGYSGNLQASGGSGNYNYSVSHGSLPDGLSLNNKTGQVSGTPTHHGTWVFTPRVTDSNGNWSETNCVVVVCD